MQVSPDESERQFTGFLQNQTVTDPLNFTINLDNLRQRDPLLAEEVILNPSKFYRQTKTFLQHVLMGEEKPKYDAKLEHFSIEFVGNLGTNFVTPRGLNSRLVNQLVGLQGIVTKMEVSRFQLEKSVHWCENTKAYHTKEYPDHYNPAKQFDPHKTAFIPIKDDENNPMSLEQGLSSLRNIQHIVLQELPQMAPTGLLPMSVNVIIQNKLINQVKPGDRVQMIGIYKLISGAFTKEKGIFKSIFLCFSLQPFLSLSIPNKIPDKLKFQPTQLYNLFSRSIAPSIHGHDYLKKAVLLMLLGGCQKVLSNGTHLRGDINVLFVGDPGTAKSQMLRWVLNNVPLAIGTTGSGASGVGLTAAIVSDKETGEKSLEAGAMVLADRGVVCIDEFDKMNELDRVAVHEVMEQQTVTIAKAGMHCSLNARCSVLAAANPAYGQYMPKLSPSKNINMPDSLLSRFDLIFILQDEKNPQLDRKIAERVCKNHRLAPTQAQKYNQFNENDDFIIRPLQSTNKTDDKIYQNTSLFKSSDNKHQILSQSFLKSYIQHCKTNFHPNLTQQSVQLLSGMWLLLRAKDAHEKTTSQTKVLPITIRSHQTLIRLSTAHAKLRRSLTVDTEDCVEAFRIVVYSLEKDQNQYNNQLQELLDEIGTHFNLGNKKKNKEEKSKKSQTNKITNLIKGVQKIAIDKDDEEVEKILPQKGQFTKEDMKNVYRKVAELKNKFKNTGVPVKSLCQQLKHLNRIQIIRILQEIQNQGKGSYDKANDVFHI